ncbi:MAG: 30S ribosomal protein S2 [Candidatus Omnitrophica bacterium]|nr:30S ribosomal protein S2 [Candidatus Omnitrophota bacterium]
MSIELIKELLEAGVHFGHRTSRWNPKMKKYIFGQRSGIYIIDLEKTVECLTQAKNFILEITSQGATVLFVGTKRQAQDIIENEAKRCGMYWVNNRWLGGMLTNFFTIKKNLEHMKRLEKMKEDGVFEKLTKKEASRLEKELQKLQKNFSGIINIESLPSCLFIIDIQKEQTALREARRLKIPVVAMIDTTSDPDMVDYPIPANDDGIKSIQLITSHIADAVIEGRKRFLEYLSHSGVDITAIKKEETSSLEEPIKINLEDMPEVSKIEDLDQSTKVSKKTRFTVK